MFLVHGFRLFCVSRCVGCLGCWVLMGKEGQETERSQVHYDELNSALCLE